MDRTSKVSRDEHAPAHGSALRYVAIWAALIALTATSYIVSRLHLGGADLFVALGIAAVKTSLVLLFFMHLIERPGTAVLAPIIAFAFIGLLISLVTADVLTRTTFPRAPLTSEPDGPAPPAPPAGGPVPSR